MRYRMLWDNEEAEATCYAMLESLMFLHVIAEASATQMVSHEVYTLYILSNNMVVGYLHVYGL